MTDITNSNQEPTEASMVEQTKSISEVLIDLADHAEGERLSIGTLVDALEDRAFGLLLLIFALPCCLPFLYGVPQIVALPMLFVAAQVAIGRHRPWLPEFLRKRTISAEGFRDMAHRAKRYIGWFESISKPRLTWLVNGPVERLLGLFLLVFSASILVPLPGTNTIPGIAVAIMSIGIMEKDSLLIFAGTILGAIWVSLLATLGTGAIALIVSFFS